MTFPARHIAVSVECAAEKAYAYASNPENLPAWASGLADGVRKDGGAWVASSPMGDVRVSFVAENPFGVLDHEVTLPSGEAFLNPMRVVPNNEGCEVTFTLFRHPGTTDEAYEEDTQTIEGDLQALKEILEA